MQFLEVGDKYIQYFRTRWGHLIPHASVHRHVPLLEQNQAVLKNIFIMGLLNLLAMAVIFMHKL